MIELTCPRCRSKQAVLPADPNSLFCYYCRSVLTSDESIRRLADPDDSLNPSSPASTGTPPMRPRVAKPSRAGAPNIPTIEPSGIRPPPAKRRTRAASKQRQLIAVLGGLAAATIVSMVVVTVLFKEPLVSLPPGVNTKCSHPGCPLPATRGVQSVVRELEKTGSHLYIEGESSGAYCDNHSPGIDDHPGALLISIFAIFAVLWYSHLNRFSAH